MIREAQREDTHRIAEIHVSSWQAAYVSIIPHDYLEGLSVARRKTVWENAILASKGPVFVSSQNDRIVGFCHVIPSRDDDSEGSAEITAIYIDPPYWRQGHGQALFEKAVSYAGIEGFREITLWVLAQNQRARQFYERMGSVADGASKLLERPGFVLEEIRYRRTTLAANSATS